MAKRSDKYYANLDFFITGSGLLYGLLIKTTFKQYGRVMDEKWMQLVEKWFEEERKKTAEELGHLWPLSQEADRPDIEGHR